MSDRLRRMFDQQFEFLLELHPDLDKRSTSEKFQATKDMVLHGMTEWVELLDEVKGWKTWLGTDQKTPDLNALTEEAVDVFKFVLNVLLTWGVTPDQFAEAFTRKTEVNVQRHLQHQRLGKLLAMGRRGFQVKIAALDLDGVLAAYPEHWLTFLGYNGSGGNLGVENFSLVTGAPGIPREAYTRLKHLYRSEGFEAEVPAMPGAAEFTRHLKALGYYIVIISARPVERYKRLYSDSIRWLMQNGITYDAVLWDANKEDRIIRDLPGVDFVLDDDPANVERLTKAGINAFMLARPYNEEARQRLPWVRNFDEVINVMKGEKQ